MPAIFTDRRQGFSLAPYESFNLAHHVGDDVEAVNKNRALLVSMVGPTQFMNQVHGDVFVRVDGTTEVDPICDALITTTKGISLAVMVADCIPLLLQSQSVAAAVHVGRKGVHNGIALKVVAEMRRLGAVDIHATLGASICGRCYEVSQAIQDEVCASNPQAFSLTREQTPALDLPKALIARLVEQGVTYEASTVCTLEDPNHFSYRRHNITGRSAGVVWL
ncbi:MAG: peptidoglycan editing factor PgeF [Candidatus Planktophila sp.]